LDWLRFMHTPNDYRVSPNRINKIFFMAFFFWFITKVTQENHKKLVNTIIVDREKPKIKN
ncbi:hypothetical protein, partial [Bacteroides sp.]|uniref:hypothetical protein n=1 Tax=Bacteroides sp. TaxID=29523 RepID=UPI0025870739